MRLVIVWFRFVLVLLSMLILVVGVLIFSTLSLWMVHYPIRKIWSICLIASTGAKLKFHGVKFSSFDLKNTMVVSNHISWLDTVVILRLCFLRYIGKMEMLKWPILSTIIKAGGTIFLDRSKKRSLLSVNHQLVQLLEGGATIGLYPEGTTSNGKKLLPFRSPILEAAMMAKSKVIPIVLSYRKEDDRLATEVTFAKVNWITTVKNTLKLKNLVINVTILPVVESANFSTRDNLASYLYDQINQSYISQQKE